MASDFAEVLGAQSFDKIQMPLLYIFHVDPALWKKLL